MEWYTGYGVWAYGYLSVRYLNLGTYYVLGFTSFYLQRKSINHVTILKEPKSKNKLQISFLILMNKEH